MKSFVLFLLSLLWVTLVFAERPCKCDVNTRVFEEINCKPIYESKDQCCPIRYECSEYLNAPSDECYLQGKSYPNGTEIQTHRYGYCETSCTCTDGNILCPPTSCPEIELPKKPSEDCRVISDPNNCCVTGYICPPFDKIPQCNVNGKIYYAGEQFSSPKDNTINCYCKEGFTGEMVEPFCKKTPCNSAWMFKQKFNEQCGLIYHTDVPEQNCPIDFLCEFKLSRFKKIRKSSRHKCNLHGLLLNVGDTYKDSYRIIPPGKVTTMCECKIPPYVTCHETIEMVL